MPHRRDILRTIGSTGLALTAIGTAAAHGTNDHDPNTIHPKARNELAQVRRATAKYHEIERAKADGYLAPEEHCVSNPNGPGAMGVHFVNPALRGDGEVEPTEPEVLLYEPHENEYKLVGVEYLAATDAFEERPSLFGQPFHGPFEPHSEQGAEHYELHVWCWRHNPNGVFAPFNPTVSCPDH